MNKSILIIGGGTAGWMTAALLAKRWPNCKLQLIESENIPTVGVGEGSTPYIRKLFETLNIKESEWMPKCNATFKNGIRFSHWATQPQYEHYFHPFLSQFDQDVIPSFEQHTQLRRQGYAISAHPDHYFLTTALTNQRQSAQLTDTSDPRVTLYAYHFDAALLGNLLKDKAQQLGVTHLTGTIEQVNQSPAGDISNVYSKENGLLHADIFVDCTGFNALLIEKTLQIPFISYKDNLFNDSAIAIASPPQQSYLPQTVSTALDAGWAWQIPLTNRTGNGYVYSSEYQSAESAEKTLRAHINNADTKEVTARHIKMRVGRSAKHWDKNCLAVGLSQGFIEPLEATSLHLIQHSIESFIDAYEKGNASTEYKNDFNSKINYAFERVRDYILMHYYTNSRTDTQYWRDCRNIPISDSLKRIMYAWYNGLDLAEELELQQIEQYYPSASWHALLAGCGVFPPLDPAKKEDFSQELTSIITRRQQLCTLFKKL